DLALAQRVEPARRVAHLNRERVFVDPDPADFAALASDDANGQILGVASGEHRQRALRQRRSRIDDGLAQMIRARGSSVGGGRGRVDPGGGTG
ncbi:hypothetical protein B4Q13_17375, partial [Lacticaseibacillus rhamnosus]